MDVYCQRHESGFDRQTRPNGTLTGEQLLSLQPFAMKGFIYLLNRNRKISESSTATPSKTLIKTI